MPNNDQSAAYYRLAQSTMADYGYRQYEISNWSKPKLECNHNFHYWEIDPYLAFGPSAHGYDGSMRWWNISSLDDYINILFKNERPIAGSETLSHLDKFNEALIYGLRSNRGISTEVLKSIKRSGSFRSKLQKWENHLDISTEIIRIKPGHYHLVAEISTEMLISDY